MARRGFLLAGKSGAGKSTISRNMLQCAGVELLSDDRMILRKTEAGFVTDGTPWAGEADIARNRTVPLGGVLFIHQGHENRVEPLAAAQALELLLPLVSIPWYDRPLLDSYLDVCNEVIQSVPCFRLTCTQGPDAGQALADYVHRHLLG